VAINPSLTLVSKEDENPNKEFGRIKAPIPRAAEFFKEVKSVHWVILN
jgi:hypothetical protein